MRFINNGMKFLSPERLSTWVLPTALACVLIALAVLQYRWSSQVSDAATTRIRASLQDSMMNFRQDFSRELANLCLELQVQPETAGEDAKILAQKLEQWQRTNSVPNLVDNLYFWAAAEVGDGKLFRVVLPAAHFQPIPWPSQLEALQQALSPIALVPPTGLNARGAAAQHTQTTRPEENFSQIGGIDQRVPVLVISATPNSKSNWLLVQLNLNVLQRLVFPQLATRYFGDPDTSDYEVAVTAGGDNPQILYSSMSGFLNAGSNSDLSLNLFGPPSHGKAQQPSVNFLGASGVRSTGSQSPLIEDPGKIFGPVRFDPIHYGTDDQDWRIVVRHRKGSIEAAVAGLRQRNLALSFGVLLVLAFSMALIIFNSHRARRLAKLQFDFVAGVSHELRTPVAAILSISDNIASGVISDKKKFTTYGELIRNQARLLSHLVEQVLRFSATTNRVNGYNIRLLEVTEVIDKALENTAGLITSSGIEVQRDIEANLPLVQADFNALLQCVQNLITNALKYGDGKRISIQAEADPETVRTREVRITVADRGIGIDSEDLNHIFEPFYRSPKVAESDVHGTGLGLALAKTFAEAMGGSITVKSELGKATAFTLHLPAGKQVDVEPKPETELQPRQY